MPNRPSILASFVSDANSRSVFGLRLLDICRLRNVRIILSGFRKEPHVVFQKPVII